MKDKIKKPVTIMAAGVMLLTSAVPASAQEMQNFPTQSKSGYYASYVRGIQTMLVNYSTSTRKYIINAGGVDGSYGNGTCNGVKAFQGAVGLDIDGACGKNTWTKFRSTLRSTGTTNSYKNFTGNAPYFSEGYNMRQVNAYNGAWQCYWYGWKSVG